MTFEIYLAIGIVVSVIAIAILIKVEPPWDDAPTFGEFASTILLCIMMAVVGTMVWPLIASAGGLWLVWRRLYDNEKVEEL